MTPNSPEPDPTEPPFASRAGAKLAAALEAFGVSAKETVCADLGCSTGGFVDCLLRAGAAKVYAVDRGYGVLDYRLRNDPRVVVMERTDALHVHLPEPVGLITIDTGWTRQSRILPAARRLLGDGGCVITLVKPHYEAPPELLQSGILPDSQTATVLSPLRTRLPELGFTLAGESQSPLRGRAGNQEHLWHLIPA